MIWTTMRRASGAAEGADIGASSERPRSEVARGIGLWVVLAIVAGAAGCGRSRSSADFTPSPATALNAVERGLEAWKSGAPAGPVPETSIPVIHVTDAGRKPGQTLDAYKILGETRGSAGRTYAVVLDLKNPDEQVKTQYIVVGIDPLWVFRQADYELLMHWDHHMPAEETGSAAPDNQPPE